MRCFSSPGSPRTAYAFSGRYLRVAQLSFLIQTSRDQRSFASFPGLIAGYHVFRRLSMPRHPPCTLSSLTTVTDHRPTPLGKGPNVRTAGNGSDHIDRQGHVTYSCDAPVSPKRCSTTPGPKRKRPCLHRRGRNPGRRKTQCRGSRILRGLSSRGITATQASKTFC
jgi:hypothetical protein